LHNLFSLSNLSDEENEHRIFQQDDVTAHTANNSMAASHNSFGDQIMNQPSFMAYYYLLGHFKDNIYNNNTYTEGALKVTIWLEATTISRQNSKLFLIVYLLHIKHATEL
jgi:hypothetical protein